MKRSSKCILFVVSIASLSCTKFIDFKEEESKPKVVINSLFTNDEPISVNLSKSQSVLVENQLGPIEGANVFIKNAGDQVLDTLFEDSLGYYSGSMIPSEEIEYHIEVNHPEYDQATASNTIPKQALIQSYNYQITTDPNNGDQMNISVEITDTDPEQNYFALEFIYGQDLPGIPTTEYVFYYTSNDPIFDDSDEDEYSEIRYFSDNLFNGGSYQIDVSGSSIVGQGNFIEIRLHSLSKDYYLYSKTLENYGFSEGNPFAQPVPVHSNVTGGMGIFVGKPNRF